MTRIPLATRFSVFVFALALVQGLTPRVSWAGGTITFDPMTYIEDLSSALSGVQETASGIESDLYEGEMLRYQIAQLKNLNPGAVNGMLNNAGLTSQVQAYQNVLYGLDNVYGSVKQLRGMMAGQNLAIEQTGLNGGTDSWSAHLAAAVGVSRKQGVSAVSAMKSTYAALQSADSNISALQQDERQTQIANPTTRGQMTVMNAQLSLIARQNQSLLGALGPDIVSEENHLSSLSAEEAYKNSARLAASKRQTEQTQNRRLNNAATGKALMCSGLKSIDANPIVQKESGSKQTGCNP